MTEDANRWLEDEFTRKFYFRYKRDIRDYFEPEYWIELDGQNRRVDFYCKNKDLKLIIEVEGRTKFSQFKDKHNDHARRHNALTAAGYKVLYFTRDDIVNSADVTVWPALDKVIKNYVNNKKAIEASNQIATEIKQQEKTANQGCFIIVIALIFLFTLSFLAKIVKAPTTTTPSSQTQTEQFVLYNPSSQIYHQPHCPIAKACKQCVKLSLQQAINNGGRQSKICNFPAK